jgi:glycosyltransferase involved in cell wall biosynthesis
MPMGPLLDLAEAEGVADRFVFELRFVDDAEIPAIFRRADVVVFPYREIDASGVLMTAISAQRPVIATAIGGFAELLRDGETGLLVPPGDPLALARALARIVDDGELRWSLAAAAAQLRHELPRWSDIAANTLALYRSLVSASARPRTRAAA